MRYVVTYLIMLAALSVVATPEESYDAGYQAVKEIVQSRVDISGETPEMSIKKPIFIIPDEELEEVEEVEEVVEVKEFEAYRPRKLFRRRLFRIR